MQKKRRKRFHVVVVREDGKLVHNGVLEWLHIRNGITLIGSVLGGLALGTLAFFVMVVWHGDLVAHNLELKRQESRMRASLLDLGKSLEEARMRLGQSQKKLAGIEDLAREQNLKITPSAGLGGPSSSATSGASSTVGGQDSEIRDIVAGIGELKQQTDEVARETENVSKVLVPHLEQMAKMPTIWPVKGFVASAFGSRSDPIVGEAEYHTGIDISAPYGSPVVAPAEGLVVYTGWENGYGQTIEISHNSGLMTRFGHLSKILVTPGQTVKRWQKIGQVGTSGRTTGPHLHYEILKDAHPVNPRRYILF